MSLKRFSASQIKPTGWLLHEMRRDLDGFVGSLDELVPDLFRDDDIYGKNRLTPRVKAKDIGSLNEGWGWEVQYLWWGAEMLSNWLDGLSRYAFVLNDESSKQKVRFYLDRAFDAQAPDGYVGIYSPDLRYHFNGENGELWAQATLFRAALSYDAASGETRYRKKVIDAVECTMKSYPIWNSQPYQTTEDYSGLTHGLMFTDVLYELYLLSNDERYIEYAQFLYEDYCRHPVHDQDLFRNHLRDPQWRMRDHGAHVYEQIRAIITAAVSGTGDYAVLMRAYHAKLPYYLQPSGGPIGDECVLQRCANADQNAYEYCSIFEVSRSYEMLLETTEDLQWAERAEHTVYNAGFAARHPLRSLITYLTHDNADRLMGDGMKTVGIGDNARYKYSATHQDAAVCCVPNAGRLLPYFLQHMYFLQDDVVLVAMFGPSRLTGEWNGKPFELEQITSYPFENKIQFSVISEAPITLHMRIPSWCDRVVTKGIQSDTQNNMLVISCEGTTTFEVEFCSGVKAHVDLMGNDYFTVGALVYSHPVTYREHYGLAYQGISRDIRCEALSQEHKNLRSLVDSAQTAQCVFKGKDIQNPPVYDFHMRDATTEEDVVVEMMPIGCTVLRKTTFAIGDERLD